MARPVYRPWASITGFGHPYWPADEKPLKDNGEEVEGDRSVETSLDDSEVTKFLEKWNNLWQPKVSDDQVQNMINNSLGYGHKEQEDGGPSSILCWGKEQNSQYSEDGSAGSKHTDSQKENEQEVPSDPTQETVEVGGLLKVSTVESKQEDVDTGDTVMQKSVKETGRPEHFL